MFIVNPRVQGVTPELVELFQKVCTSTIGHMTDFGFAIGLQPLTRPIRFVGNAVTVRIPYLDSTAVHQVLDLVKPGDVVLIDMSGDHIRACWGGGVTYAAKVKKIAGVIVDGCICDYQEMLEYGLPAYYRQISPITTRVLGKEGEINTPINICGVTVYPGDLVVADDDGIFIANPKRAEEFGRIALEKQNKEPEMRKRMDEGMSLATKSGASKHFPQGL